jgi:hypothetical protein
VTCPAEPVSAVWLVPCVSDVASPVWAEPWSDAEPPADPTEPSPDCGPFCTPAVPADDVRSLPGVPLPASALMGSVPLSPEVNQNRVLPEETSCCLFAPVEMPSG